MLSRGIWRLATLRIGGPAGEQLYLLVRVQGR